MMAMVEQFCASGETQEEFVYEHGLAISVLRYWGCKVRTEN